MTVRFAHHTTYFVFDIPNETHYTDTLMALRTPAYLWHELKRQRRADVILFVGMQLGQMTVQTRDSASREFLNFQNNLFIQHKKLSAQALENNTVDSVQSPISKLNRGDRLLEWLCDCAEKNNTLNLALVVEQDAFSRLRQTGQIRMLPSNCTTVVCLEADARSLEKALLLDSNLRESFDSIDDCLRGEREPLMSVLKRQLGERMICLFDQQEDILNMLLRHAALSGSCTDTMRQLKDQAEYLHLCRRYRRMYLLSNHYVSASGDLLPLSTIAGDLDQFQDNLRKRTRQLRQRYPDIPVEDAMRLEGLIPEAAPEFPVYRDKLANDVFSLWKLHLDEKIPNLRTADTTQLLKLTQLWNKPRNQMLAGEAEAFCAIAHNAYAAGQWDTVNDALYVLRFFADQICAPESQNQNLEQVISLGRTILSDAQMMAAADRIAGMFSYSAPTAGSMKNVTEYIWKFQQMTSQQSLNNDQIELQLKRIKLQQRIASFYQLGSTPEQLAADLKEINAQYEQMYDQALKTRKAVQSAAGSRISESKKTAAEPRKLRAAEPQPEPKASPAPTTHEDDLRITRKLLDDCGMPGGTGFYEDYADQDDETEDVL